MAVYYDVAKCTMELDLSEVLFFGISDVPQQSSLGQDLLFSMLISMVFPRGCYGYA